jgi:beta-lactamase superfamily II metal-dependent hydrolase
MFRIEMLPADHGDSLWMTYGSAAKPRHLLIDGGPPWAYPALRERVLRLTPAKRTLELLVVTHVDEDHVGGVVELLGDEALGLTINRVWFNGWKHLRAAERDLLGPVQGEMLSALIRKRQLAWNEPMQGGPVVVDDDGPPRFELPGGLRLVVLSPTRRGLARLRPKWEREVRAAGLDPGSAAHALRELKRRRRRLLGGKVLPNVTRLAAARFREDDSVTNGSSIALLAEYRDACCLLAGDAHPRVVCAALNRYRKRSARAALAVDAVKLSHHGSGGNTSPALFELARAKKYLFSTSGARSEHPDAEAVARAIVTGGPGAELFFNYRSEQTAVWDEPRLCRRHRYTATYPAPGKTGLAVEL